MKCIRMLLFTGRSQKSYKVSVFLVYNDEFLYFFRFSNVNRRALLCWIWLHYRWIWFLHIIIFMKRENRYCQKKRIFSNDKCSRINYQNGFLICIILIYRLFVGCYYYLWIFELCESENNLWDQSSQMNVKIR
jgi:hypothetical protein